MARTVEQIRLQIAKLQQQEKALLEKEIEGVVARIREAVAHYKLTPERIFGEATKQVLKVKSRAAASSKTKPAPVRATLAGQKHPSVPKGTKIAIKYRDDQGNEWSGRGSQPRWLRSAVEGGKKPEDFLVA